MDSNHVLIGFVAVVGLRLALRKKLKHQSFNKNSKQKVRFHHSKILRLWYFVTLLQFT